MEHIKGDAYLAVKTVIFRGNQVLFLRRSKEEQEKSRYHHEVWDFPGGGVQQGEHCLNALKREIMEETALEVAVGKPFHVFDVIRPQVHLCIITYVSDYIDGEVFLSGEHDAYFWFTREEMKYQGIPKWMLRQVEEAFEEKIDEKQL